MALAKKGKVIARTTRLTISFPTPLYEELERMALGKKVSLGWVVREAAEKYVGDQWPLLRTQVPGSSHDG